MSKKRIISSSRFLSLLLAICMMATGLLTGCGKTPSNGNKGDDKNNGNGQMGRYVEDTLASLDGVNRVLGVFRDTDGNIGFYAMKNDGAKSSITRNIISKDGKVESADAVGLNELIAGGGSVNEVSVGADGVMYAIYSSGLTGMKLAKSMDGKTFKPIEIPGWSSSGMPVSPDGGTGTGTGTGGNSAPAGGEDSLGGVELGGSLGRFPGGVIGIKDGFLILYADGVSQYSDDGELVREYKGAGQRGLASVYGNQVAIADVESSEVIIYDLDTGKQVNAYQYDDLNKVSSYIGLDENGVFVADSSGIFRRGDDGWKMIVDGWLTSLAIPNNIIAALVSGSNEDFYAFLGNSDFKLMHYVYSADTPLQPSTTLEIFSLYDNNTIRQAIGEFQRKNPDVRVNLRVGMDESSGATTEDVIRALNTELLAGKGPDLIVLDGLPVDSYIEKGVLKDSSELAAQLTSKLGLLDNLMKAYAKNGKIYGFPSRFILPVMMGQEEKLKDLNSLSDLVNGVVNGQNDAVPLLRTPDSLWGNNGMLMDYYEACVNDWTREDGSIDESALAKFLTDVLHLDKTLKERSPGGSAGFEGAVAVPADSTGAGNTESVDLGAMDLVNGKALVHVQQLNGMIGLTMISSLSNKAGMKLMPLFNENKYYPKGGIGIVAAGKQQSVAEAFVETLLSPEVQDKYLYDGFPVNGKSLNNMIEKPLGGDERLNDMGFVELSKKINIAVLPDQVVKDAVRAQVKDLLSGAVTPEQAAAKIVESTRLYLAE